MSKTMAEVLAEHTEIRIFGLRCRCGTPLSTDDALGSLAAHQAAALSAAGFGLVADAKAEALEELAVILEPPGVLWWGDRGVTVAEPGRPTRWTKLNDWLRNRAANLRAAS